MAGPKMRILAAQEGFLDDDIAVVIGHKSEDTAVGPGKAVSAPVITEQIALVRLGKRRAIITHDLGVSAAHVFEARRRQRMPARQPVVVHSRPAVTVIIDAIEYPQKPVRIALA